MTMLDRRVAQIYVSMDRRTRGNTYNSYVLALATKYGSPEKSETKYYHNGVETGSSGKHLRWSMAINTWKAAKSNTPSPSGAGHSMRNRRAGARL